MDQIKEQEKLQLRLSPIKKLKQLKERTKSQIMN